MKVCNFRKPGKCSPMKGVEWKHSNYMYQYLNKYIYLILACKKEILSVVLFHIFKSLCSRLKLSL